MAYRDVDLELERRRALVSEREELRRAPPSRASREQIEALDVDIETIELSRRARVKARVPVVLEARLAKPCGERWETMVGEDAVRSCVRCDRPVFDLALMTLSQAEAFLAAPENRARCVRLHERVDGTLMFADCEVGVRAVRRRQLTVAAGAVALASAALVGSVERDERVVAQPTPVAAPSTQAWGEDRSVLPLPVEPPTFEHMGFWVRTTDGASDGALYDLLRFGDVTVSGEGDRAEATRRRPRQRQR